MTDAGAGVRRSWQQITAADPPDAAGDAVLDALRHRIPRRTGRLQRSARVTAPGVVTVSTPYAAVIDRGWRRHGITPARYADQAAADATDDVAAAFAAAAQDQLDRI